MVPIRMKCPGMSGKTTLTQYLILHPSPYTKDEMLNYKSLGSFKNFQNGWVREVLVKEMNRKRVVIGKVGS